MVFSMSRAMTVKEADVSESPHYSGPSWIAMGNKAPLFRLIVKGNRLKRIESSKENYIFCTAAEGKP